MNSSCFMIRKSPPGYAPRLNILVIAHKSKLPNLQDEALSKNNNFICRNLIVGSLNVQN